jgi:hypothetical protein
LPQHWYTKAERPNVAAIRGKTIIPGIPPVIQPQKARPGIGWPENYANFVVQTSGISDCGLVTGLLHMNHCLVFIYMQRASAEQDQFT